MNTLDVLKQARKLISNPARWIKGAEKQVSADGKTASFCSIGAVNHILVENKLDMRLARGLEQKALNRAAFKKGYSSLVGLNDDSPTTHADVMNMFDDAIAEIEAKYVELFGRKALKK